MAELEIHHEGHESDPVGQKVGVMAAIIAVFLAVVYGRGTFCRAAALCSSLYDDV